MSDKQELADMEALPMLGATCGDEYAQLCERRLELRLRLLTELRVAVMTVVSDPHLSWPEARAKLTEALNDTFVKLPADEQGQG